MKEKVILPLIAFVGVFSLLYVAGPANKTIQQPPVHQQPFWPIQPPGPIDPLPLTRPQTPQISVKIPPYLAYLKVVDQIKKWNQEAPDLTEVGTYGKSTRGTDLYYIRVTNKLNTQPKPKVLIHACIHGNEPLSTSVMMGYIGTILEEYGKDQAVTELLDTRDIYFVPIISPDSHPNSRHVDGVDPNRNYPTEADPSRKSVAPVQAIREFFLKHQFKAVISAHTWGRVFLIPYGDRDAKCPDWDAYQKIVGEMGKMCNYRMIRAFDMYKANGGLNNPPIRVAGEEPPYPCCYNMPIFGSEVDWYYKNGAFSSSQNGEIHQGAFSIVMEMGTHQRIPSMQDIKTEFDMTFRAVLHFIKEAPLVEIWWKNGQPVNRDGTPKKIALRTAATDYDTICNGNHTNEYMMTDMASSVSAIYPSTTRAYYQKWLLEFSIVMEMGTHQRILSDADTKAEFDKTYRAILLFIQEGAIARKSYLDILLR